MTESNAEDGCGRFVFRDTRQVFERADISIFFSKTSLRDCRDEKNTSLLLDLLLAPLVKTYVLSPSFAGGPRSRRSKAVLSEFNFFVFDRVLLRATQTVQSGTFVLECEAHEEPFRRWRSQ